MSSSRVLLPVLLVLLLASPLSADWWDDFVNAAHDKAVAAADWLRDKAAPKVREKFDAAKEKLQDPETHEKVQEWVEEEAVPVIKQKFEQFKAFINDDLMPELQKMIQAGKEAHKKRHQNDGESAADSVKDEDN